MLYKIQWSNPGIISFFFGDHNRVSKFGLFIRFLIIVVSQDPGSVKDKSVSVILLAGGKGKRMGVSFPRFLSCNKLIHYLYCPYRIYISDCIALVWEKNVFWWMIAFVYSLLYAVCSRCISSYSWSFISDYATGKHAEAVSSTSRPTRCNVQVDSNISDLLSCSNFFRIDDGVHHICWSSHLEDLLD